MFKLSRKTGGKEVRRVSVLGIGGGGCRVLDRIGCTENGPMTAVVDLDAQSLNESSTMTRILPGATEEGGGLGAGGSAENGRRAALKDIEMLRGMFTNADVAVIVTCLGGGSGSGVTPVALQEARDLGVFTIVLATMPFEFEGTGIRAVADRGLQAVSAVADIVGVIENDRLFGSLGDGNIKELFGRADDVLAAGVEGLWQMLAQPAFIGIDAADLRAVVEKSGGSAVFGFGGGRGAKRVESALQELLEGPVFDKGRLLRESGAVLVCIAGGREMTLRETGEIMEALSREIPADCRLKMGTVVNDDWSERLLVTVFLTERKRVVRSAGAVGEKSPAKTKRRRKKDPQDKLKQDPLRKGRFKDIESTIMNGMDLDLPTFMRLDIDIRNL